MEDNELIVSRIRDLAFQADKYSIVTHTSFLSLSQQNVFYELLKKEGNPLAKKIYGVSFFLYGGKEDSDRKIIFFIPDYVKEEDLKEEIDNGSYISLLYVSPKNVKFSDKVTHRDYLGALMHLGIERSMYGDIYTDGTYGYVFIMDSLADVVKDELLRIKHTVVDAVIQKPKECAFKQQYKEKKVFLSALRIDSLIAEVFNLSRRSAQTLIASECVFVNGKLEKNNAYRIKGPVRVSIKGEGKFLFDGKSVLTKKDRYALTVMIYC